jgi:hemerythrin
MLFPVAIVSLLVHAGLGAPACSGNSSDAKGGAVTACSSSGSAMLQAQVLQMKARHGDDPSWWAADELVAEHDHRYRTFVNTLLQDTVHCSFELDAKAVDSQHRKLFTLVDQVRQLLRGRQESEGIDDGLKLAGEGLQPLKKLLVWLKQYTVVHFDAEEKTMEHVSYMDAMGHKALHRAFYGHVMMWGDIVNEMMKFNGGFHVGNVYVMVAKWLQDHVCVQDKLLGSFIEKSGQLGVINDGNTPDGVTDTMPDCVPSLVGVRTCAALLQSVGQPASVATTVPAPEWFAPAEHLAAHDHWYRAFVNTLLQSPIVCELAESFDTSVKTVDAQHRKLLSLVDQVRQDAPREAAALGLRRRLEAHRLRVGATECCACLAQAVRRRAL